MKIDLDDLIGAEVLSENGGTIGSVSGFNYGVDGFSLVLSTNYAFEGDDDVEESEIVPLRVVENEEKTDDGQSEGKA